LSFFETKERNIFITEYLNCELENVSFQEKNFHFIVNNHEIGKQLSSLVELDQRTITAEFIQFLEDLSKNKRYKKINFRVKPSSSIISSEVLKVLLLRGYCSQLSFTSLLNLNQTKEELWSNIRKSFKSLINKEEKKVKVEIYDALSTDKVLFDSWISLYSNAIKRGNKELTTQAIDSMQDAIKNNMGFIISAYEHEKLLGAIVFNYFDGSAYYSAAANVDDIESNKERYIGHLLMWEGIKKLKEIGCTELEIGPLEFENQLYCQNDSKLQNITNFKVGFGGNIISVFNFTKIITE
jgi:hypothetical protein